MKLRTQDWFVILGGLIATLFWGHGWRDWLLLAVFILLYLVARALWPKQTNLSPREEDSIFLITSSEEHDTVEREVMELDVDLSYRRSLGHFRVHRQFDIYVSDREYEYRVTPTSVSVRLLQFRSEGAGEPEEWMAHDGVVQEADMREKWAKTKYSWDNVEEKIANLKLETEWREIPPLYWNGASYFIMAKKLPLPDSRRYFRHELERLRRGIELATNELTKLNCKQTEDGEIVSLAVPDEVKASEEQWSQFWETIPKFGITVPEFHNSTVLTTQLKKLLSD